MTTHAPFCLLAVVLLLTACDNPLVALPDDVESFVRAEKVGQLRHGRRVAILPADDVHVYTVKYGEPQDCPSGCFYLRGVVLKHGGRIGWLHLDAVELVYDPQRQAARPRPGVRTYFPLLAGDDALFSAGVLDALRSADGHVYAEYLQFLLLEDGAPEHGLYRLSERLPQDGWPGLVWLFLTHPAVTCSERILQRIAELHSEQRDYSRERAAARELLDTFPERCS
jgi:hypothetical protein